VAVVGESGSGKTTLAMALLRFLDPVAGHVRLSGVDTRELDGDAVRRVVGLLAQDAHIFDSTVWENVRLARPAATRSEVRAALAGARLLDWVDGLPDGLETEPAEHLDLATADALLHDLLAATRERTVLAITHRLHGFQDFDEIVVLHDGRVTERGTHHQLMRVDGRYRAAYEQEAYEQEAQLLA